MTSPAAITLDKKTLESGLYTLLGSISTTISTNFEFPVLSHEQLRDSSTTLSTYLGHFAMRNLRRATTPLDPSNLEFHVFRTRNAEDPTYNGDGNIIKGKKDWYRLVLSESDKKSADVQILMEGNLAKNKEELLDAFLAAVKESLEKWVEAGKKRDKALKESKKPEKKKAAKKPKRKAKFVEIADSEEEEDVEDEEVKEDMTGKGGEYLMITETIT
jgi:gas vesicle protein